MSAERPAAYTVSSIRLPAEKVAHALDLGRTWGRWRKDTLARVRELPTYDPATDTAVVCRAFVKPLDPLGFVL